MTNEHSDLVLEHAFQLLQIAVLARDDRSGPQRLITRDQERSIGQVPLGDDEHRHETAVVRGHSVPGLSSVGVVLGWSWRRRPPAGLRWQR